MAAVTDIISTHEAEKGFYPTPESLADKLLEGIDWHYISSVLEPSAGKGNLVEAVGKKAYLNIHRHCDDKGISVDCVEIDPHLRSILQYEFGGGRENDICTRLNELSDKQRYSALTRSYGSLTESESMEEKHLKMMRGKIRSVDCHIIHDNFLTFASRKEYDLIVMNPPFADGDAHLLKAIQLQERSGGAIRCLLNAETIRNPYTNRRRALVEKLQALNAEITYEDGAFLTGERKTGVSVAIIKILIPRPERESEIFTRMKKAAELEEATMEDITDLAVSDFIKQIVTMYNVEVDAGIALIREYIAMKPRILDSFDCSGHLGDYATLTLVVGSKDRMYRSDIPSINEYVRLTRKKYWEALFKNPKFTGKLTSNLRTKYQQLVGNMVDYDFTEFNIQQIALQMNAEMNQGIQDTIVALFDRMTEKHSWYPECEKNTHYFDGWKTNKAHKIGSKVILPVNGMFSTYSWERDTFSVDKATSTISDIEKVFDYLDGNMTTTVDLRWVLSQACENGVTKNIHCKYFDVTLYKKGTMHLKFRNQELVDRFNIYCCRKKNWLPPCYGKAAYSSMTAEEKTVVDGFNGDGSDGSGEVQYTAVLQKANYFLSEPVQDMPLLAAPEEG